MKKLVCLIMVMAIASVACAGNQFNDATGDHLWSTVGNWGMAHVPEDSTTNPGSYVPQWGNAVEFTASNAVMNIGTGEAHDAYAFQLGTYGADNTALNMSGGILTVGGWGTDVGRGNAGHGAMDGTLTMTGGTINAGPALQVPQYWDNTGTVSDCVGVVNASSGVINAGFMRIGMYDGDGTVNLSGDVVVNLDTALQMNVGWGGWDEPSLAMSASLAIDGGASLLIGGVGDYTPGEGDPTIEEVLQAEMDIYQAYMDFGWITSNTGTLSMSYNETTDVISIVPEPATMILLGLGGLLIRRKR